MTVYDTACPDHPGTDYLFGPLTPETLARMRQEAQGRQAPHAGRGGVPLATVLAALAEGAVTGRYLARRLGISLAAVGVAVRRARRRGITIDHLTGIGYRLRQAEAAP